jgi:hypothetical protein
VYGIIIAFAGIILYSEQKRWSDVDGFKEDENVDSRLITSPGSSTLDNEFISVIRCALLPLVLYDTESRVF